MILSELLDHRVDQPRRDQGPGGVVDHHDLTGAQRQRVGDRFGAVLDRRRRRRPPARPAASSSPAGAATTISPIAVAPRKASSDHSSIGRPPTSTNAFGPPAPSRLSGAGGRDNG